MTNIIKANFGKETICRTAPAYQYDYGQLISFPGLNLPVSFECHFSNSDRGNSVTQIGADNAVTIPDAMFQSGDSIYAWVFLHTGEDDGETEYMAVIPILKRAKPSNDVPTPVQQDAITQAIAALNAAVEQTGHDVTDAAASASAALASEQAAARSETNAGNSATAAGQSATAAGQSATAAGQSATAAGQSATAAHQSELNASASESAAASSAADAYRDAERAEQAANTAGYMDVEIIDGRLIYTRTDAVDVDFELKNGHLLMEVI